MNKNLLRCGCVFLILSGCQVFENEGQKKVRSLLKHPESARFANTMSYTKDGHTAYCGEVDFKNSDEAPTGFSRYVVIDQAVFIGDEINILKEGASSYNLLMARLTITTIEQEARIKNIKEKNRQIRANVSNPTEGTYTASESAWETYCTPPPRIMSEEEACERDYSYYKSIYHEQMKNGEYYKASKIEYPSTCSRNNSVVNEIKVMASEAEFKHLFDLASGSKNIIKTREFSINEIKNKFSDKLMQLKYDINLWEADIKTQKERRFTDSECHKMKLLLPGVAKNIGMKLNLTKIIDGAESSDTPQVYDAMLTWVGQYNSASLIEHPYEMANTFWALCKSGKIRNGYRPN